ncbi:MAG: DUF1592 domain-containing protein [Verrucomicrobiota bacterium]
MPLPTHKLHRSVSLSLLLCLLSPFAIHHSLLAAAPGGALEALYTFDDPQPNDIINDSSGASPPLNLKISNPKAVTQRNGGLTVSGKTTILTPKSASRLSSTIKESGVLTIETWITPADKLQEGPARIITLSEGNSDRLFTLGHDKDVFDVRFRTSQTNKNGTPSTSSPESTPVSKSLTHVVFTREQNGNTRLFIDGKQVSQKTIAGSLDPWAQPFRLGLANESNGQRPWHGTYHLVALYSRALSPGEVTARFRAGPDAPPAKPKPANPNATLFEEKIAALLANHCIECHDPSTNEGRLDLSQKATAFASKGTIIPGNAHDSLLWELVENDEMPEDRDPLSKAEKDLLRQWINEGATWTLDVIDPSNYRHQTEPGEIWVRRLTVPEYINTVQATLDIDVAKEARELLPPELRADGFSNTAYNLSVDLDHVEAYAELAAIIAQKIDPAAFAKRFSPKRNVNDKDMFALIRDIGKWLLRGPLTQNEQSIYRGITTSVVSAGGDFDEAVTYLVEAMIQSPRFIYRIEKQQGDGSLWPVSDFELASRMSYTIWGAPPDTELYADAEKGRLADPNLARAHAERMLRDPRAVEQSVRFLTDWLNLNRLDSIRPNPDHFPDWQPALADDMRRETIAFFKELVWNQNRPLTDLFNASFTFVTPRLAKHYNLPLDPDREIKSDPVDRLLRVNLEHIPSRGGLLTHGSILTIGGEEASMVTRGLFVFNDLFRGTVNNPPPGLDTTPIPTKPGLTHRDGAEIRIADRNCGDCHGKFEPMAFGLEKYDGLGAWRQQDEHGNPLRDDGTILVPGAAKPIAYDNSAQLMNLLATNNRVAESLTRKLAQFAIGRPLTAQDIPAIKSIHQNSATYQQLITNLITSDLIQKSQTTPEE